MTEITDERLEQNHYDLLAEIARFYRSSHDELKNADAKTVLMAAVKKHSSDETELHGFIMKLDLSE